MQKFLKQNSLSITLFGLFLMCMIGLVFAGYAHNNEEREEHGQPRVLLTEYLVSSEFGEAVFENWESEFLQMGALVLLTIWFVQKGSKDSKKLRGENDVDTSSRYSILHATSLRTRTKAVGSWIYSNSLSLALFGIFALSFLLHAMTGVAAANEEAINHNAPQMGIIDYVGSSQFWFESFQNWQSEFLAVGSLLVLSIVLRQRGSPESKPVGEADSKTG